MSEVEVAGHPVRVKVSAGRVKVEHDDASRGRPARRPAGAGGHLPGRGGVAPPRRARVQRPHRRAAPGGRLGALRRPGKAAGALPCCGGGQVRAAEGPGVFPRLAVLAPDSRYSTRIGRQNESWSRRVGIRAPDDRQPDPTPRHCVGCRCPLRFAEQRASRGCGSWGTRGRATTQPAATSSSWKRGRWWNGTPMSTWWARCQPVLKGTIQKRAARSAGRGGWSRGGRSDRIIPPCSAMARSRLITRQPVIHGASHRRG